MTSTVTVQSLFDEHNQRLALQWVAGRTGADRLIARRKETSAETASLSLVGHLNPIHPHVIQVLGSAELAYLNDLPIGTRENLLNQLFGGDKTVCVVVAGGERPTAALEHLADHHATPLLTTRLSSETLVSSLHYYLAAELAERITMHGVFMEVMGIGVLIRGPSGVGKSELALELLSRGHRLIADDAPEFWRISPDTISGTCPPLLQDFIEVRGLGILNIRNMFGDGAIKQNKYLRLIIALKPMSEQEIGRLDRLEGSRHTCRLLDIDIPAVTLPVAPGRNLSVLVEAAVRNHVLLQSGYNGVTDFMARQDQSIKRDLQ